MRLDEALLRTVDDAVEAGDAASRTSYVERALRTEDHRRKVERDLTILDELARRGEEPYPDLAQMLADFTYPDADA